MIRSLVVLGASGDLTARYLLPAVARLQSAGRLPSGFTVTGLAREDWDDEAFRVHAERRLAVHAPDVDEDVRRLCANLRCATARSTCCARCTHPPAPTSCTAAAAPATPPEMGTRPTSTSPASIPTAAPRPAPN